MVPAGAAGAGADPLLQGMAAGLPAGLRLQRAAGATLLHAAGNPPGAVSTRIPAPTGPGPAILLHSSVTDPVQIAAALSGLPSQDTTLAVLHWPPEQQLRPGRAREIAAQALADPARSAMLSVPRTALTGAPRQDDPLVVPLDADGAVTFFGARPERYLFLPGDAGGPARPTPYGLPEAGREPGVYQLPGGWVVWDGGNHLWIGPAAGLAHARELLPDAGGRLTEPTVFLGWHATAMPEAVRWQVGRILAAMPAAAPAHLVTSGIGLDARTLDLSTVTNLPGGVQLSHIPGGVLAHTGPRPAAGGTALHWSDLATPDRPRLVVHESVTDPAAVVRAVQEALGTAPHGPDPATLQVFLAVGAPPPPGGSTTGAAGGHGGPATRAAAAADALRQAFGGAVDLVLPVAAVGRRPAGAGEWIPVDARGQETFPAAAHAYRVPVAPAPPRRDRPLGLAPAEGGGYQVHPGWTVTEHNGVVLFAEYGTTPDAALTAPVGGVTVVVRPRHGLIPREVAATVARLLSGVPTRDQDVRVHGSPASAGPEVKDQEPAAVPPAEPDRQALAMAHPKADLPDLGMIKDALRAVTDAGGVRVPLWEGLRDRLLNNYPQLVTPDGYVFVMGSLEFRIRLNPDDPQLAPNPAGSSVTAAPGPSLDDLEHRGTVGEGRFHASQYTRGLFQTGVHGQHDTGALRATRMQGRSHFELPVGQTGTVGLQFSAAANRTDQTSSFLIDTEKGRVEDVREDLTIYSYRPGWSIEYRGDGTGTWTPVPLPPPDPAGQDRLVVAIPNNLLSEAGEQVVAELPPADPGTPGAPDESSLTRLPERYSVTGLGGLLDLYDRIVARLRNDGYDMSIDGLMRTELRTKLWNLDTHLDEAFNRRGDAPQVPPEPGHAPVPLDRRGYRFTLHQRMGYPAAVIRVFAYRHGATVRVGGTSDKAHIEKVRTAIVGHGGDFTLGQSTGFDLTGGTPFRRGPHNDPQQVPPYAFGFSAAAGGTWDSHDGGGVTNASLNVMVSRYTGMTGSHAMQFELTAEVRTWDQATENPDLIPAVDASAVVRLPEPDAFAHGFSVDLDAFTTPPPGLPVSPPAPGRARRLPYRDGVGLLRNTGLHPEDTGGHQVPAHVLAGGSLGQSLVDVDKAAAAQVIADLRRELVAAGFLPKTEESWSPATWHELHGSVSPLLDNLDLFHKMVSPDTFEAHFDTLLQDGLSLTLHRWVAGKMESAEVTVAARSLIRPGIGPDGNSVYFDRLTDEYHVVNLAMGLSIARQNAGGAMTGRVGAGLEIIRPPDTKGLSRAGLIGASGTLGHGATNRLAYIVNRPELLEYPGRTQLFTLPYEFTYTVSYSTRKAPYFAPVPVPVNVQATLLELNSNPAAFSEAAEHDTSRSVLHQGVVYSLDTHGLTAALRTQLPSLTGAGRPMTSPLVSLANLIAVKAHFKEAMYGHYGTDTLAEPGFWANTNATASITVDDLGPARFVGATQDKYVTGLIDLYLAEASNSAALSWSAAADLPNPYFAFSIAHTKGEEPLKVTLAPDWKWGFDLSSSEEAKNISGLEELNLSFDRAYAFQVPVDSSVRTGTRTQMGFVFGRNSVPPAATVRGRNMIFLLPEPDALARYADGELPVSDPQLTDAMHRWARGDLVLNGNTVSGLLHRWQQALAGRAGTGGLHAFLLQHHIRRWAGALTTRHNDPGTRDAVLDPGRRQQITDTFGHLLDPGKNPFRGLALPPYLTRTGDRSLGHHGVDDLTLFTGPAPPGGAPPTTTLLDAVRHQIDTVAPGLLSSPPHDWAAADGTLGVLVLSPDREFLGALPGGLESLQAVLAGQRVNAVFTDMLHQHGGVRFALTRRRGPVLAEVVEVMLSATLDGNPHYTDWVPNRGRENYEHAYRYNARMLSPSWGTTITPVAVTFAQDGVPVVGEAALSVAQKTTYSVKESEQGVREPTVYDWTGYYRASTDATISITVRRLKMSGRPLNSLLNDLWDAGADLISQDRTVRSDTATYPARLDFTVPRGLAEAAPVSPSARPDLRPLPLLTGDAYVTAALADDVFPAARTFLAGLLARDDDPEHYRGSVILPGLLSRLSMTTHLADMQASSGYRLASHTFIPGRSSTRAALQLHASLHSLEILHSIVNSTGTGRYAKFQTGTAASQSRDRWRANLAGGLSGITAFDSKEGPVKFVITPQANRTAPASQGVTYEDNRRAETHGKAQGPTLLVRMRGQFLVAGVRHDHRYSFLPWGSTRPIAEGQLGQNAPSTGWISGEVYAEMYADEVHLLQQWLAQEPQRWNRAQPDRWPAPAPDAHVADLDELLEQSTPAAMAAGTGAAPPPGPPARATGTVAGRRIQPGDFDPGQAAPHAALLIRDELGNHYDPVAPLRLTTDARARSQGRYTLLLNWAAAHLATLPPAQQADAGLPELTTWQKAAGTALTAQQADDRASDIIQRVNGTRPPDAEPLALPHEVTMLHQDPVTVARGVAFELHTHLDLEATGTDGTVSRYRLDYEGRVVELRARHGGHAPVTATQVVQALPGQLTRAAAAAGITPAAQERIYADLLERTPIQMEAAAQLEPELWQRIAETRDRTDDEARTWMTGGLPRPAGPAAGTVTGNPVRTPGAPPGSRAARARRLAATDLPSGWWSTGPLRQVPDLLRPGTRLWIARPQGAIAARLQADGTYRLHDPLAPHDARTVTATDFHHEFTGPQAVTLIEPDVLRSWLQLGRDWAASEQFAQRHLQDLQADATAAILAQEEQLAHRLEQEQTREQTRRLEQQAQQSSAGQAEGEPAPEPARPALIWSAPSNEPLRSLYQSLLQAIRNGQLTSAYSYLMAATPAGRHDILADVIRGVQVTPAALRALADLAVSAVTVATAAPMDTTQTTAQVRHDARVLRAVASILDPSADPIDRLRAIAATTRRVAGPERWGEPLQELADQLNEQAADQRQVADLRALGQNLTDTASGIITGQTDRLLTRLAPEQATQLADAVAAAGVGAADLLVIWESATTLAELLDALPTPPAGMRPRVTAAPPTAAPPTAAPPTAPPGPVTHPRPDLLQRWGASRDWDQSRDFLNAHPRILLSDNFHTQVQFRRAQQPGDDPTLAAQDGILTLARYDRLDEAYQYLTGTIPPTPAPSPEPGQPTDRQRLVQSLLSHPEMTEPATVAALSNLARALPGPLDRADGQILRTTGDILAGLTVGDTTLMTATVRTARDVLTEQQRQHWARTIRGLADSTSGTRGAALSHFAHRLYPLRPPAPAATGPGSTLRQDTRQQLHQAAQELQATYDALEQAGRHQQQSQDARDTARDTHDQARTALTAALDQAQAAEHTVASRTGELPGLRDAVTQAGDRVREAEQRVRDTEQALTTAPEDASLRQQVTGAQDAVTRLRGHLTTAQQSLTEAQEAIRTANETLDRIRPALPGLTRQVNDAGEALRAREISLQTHDQVVAALDQERQERSTARDTAQAQVDQLRLQDPPPARGTATDLDTMLADVARSGDDTATAAQAVAGRLRQQYGSTPPPRLVLTTDQGWQPPGGPLATDEAAVLGLDRLALAGRLARALNVIVELQVTPPGASRPRSHLAYPGGQMVRLNSIGQPETRDEAIRRLPQPVQDGLRAYQLRPDLTSALEILHEREIEAGGNFEAEATALADSVNRYQPYLAQQWVTLPDPPRTAAGTQQLGAGLSTALHATPAPAPPDGQATLTSPDSIAREWLARDTRGRANLMSDLLATVPGYTAQQPTQTRPPDPPKGTRIVVIAGSTITAGIVLRTTQLAWFRPAGHHHGTGSMTMLGNWAWNHSGNDVWYITLQPTAPDVRMVPVPQD